MIIDGKKEAAIIREEVRKEISLIKKKTNKTPGLSVILIGDFAPSLIYVKNKEKNAKEVGINSEVIKYPKEVKESVILNKIEELNNNKNLRLKIKNNAKLIAKKYFDYDMNMQKMETMMKNFIKNQQH